MEEKNVRKGHVIMQNRKRRLFPSIFYGCALTRQRKVLDDNEWTGWLQWMRNCFRRGMINETWKQIEPDGWFNPAFQNFINREIARA